MIKEVEVVGRDEVMSNPSISGLVFVPRSPSKEAMNDQQGGAGNSPAGVAA